MSSNDDPQRQSEKSRLLSHAEDQSESIQGKYTDTVEESYVQRREFSERRVIAAIALFTFFSSFSLGSVGQVQSQYLVWRLGHDDPAYANLSVDTAKDDACSRNSSDPSVKMEDEIQAKVATIVMYLNYTLSLTSLVSSMFLSTYSDVIGRRTILILTFGCQSINQTLQCVMVGLHLPLWMYYLGNAIEGLSGSWFVTLIGVYSVTADINDQSHSRTLGMVLINTLQNIAQSSSAIVTGNVIKQWGFFPANCILASFMVLALFSVVLTLPETSPIPTGKSVNPIKNLKKLFNFYLFEGTGWERLAYIGLLTLFSTAVIVDLVADGIDTLYQLHRPFCWSSTTIGYFLSYKKTFQLVSAALLLKLLQRWNISGAVIAQVAMLFYAGQWVFEGLADTSWQLFLVPVVGFSGTLTVPTIRSLMSFKAGPHHQGAIFGSICIVETAMSFTGNSIFNTIYSNTVDTFNGAAYLAMAGFSFTTFVLFFVYHFIESRTVNK